MGKSQDIDYVNKVREISLTLFFIQKYAFKSTFQPSLNELELKGAM